MTPVDPNARVQKVGVDVHSRLCVDSEGKTECVCGLDDCAHESVDTFGSGAGRRADVCMACLRVVEFWNEADR